MANKKDIIKAILKVAGNPESGVVVQNAERWADAIVALDTPEQSESELSSDKSNESSSPRATKETRIMKADETR